MTGAPTSARPAGDDVFVVRGPTPLRGRIRVPGDKSISHRALMIAALAEGVSRVSGLSTGEDVQATAAAVTAMGASVDGDHIAGGRSSLHEPACVLDLGNSGTAIRLLTGLCSGLPWMTVLTGDESVCTRPMERVLSPLRQMNAVVDGRSGGKYPPLVVKGSRLRGIDFSPPVASAQVKSAVLLAGLAAEGETVVRERVATRGHTEDMLKQAGADISIHRINPGRVVRLRPSRLSPVEVDVPGDPSQAAFWVVAACLVPGSDVVIERVYVGQARAGFLDVLERMGADVTIENRQGDVADVHARSSPLQATDVGGDEVPWLIDEIPVLAVAASAAEGTTTFRDAAELRVKETDRIAALAAELAAVGARIEPTRDGLVVEGGSPVAGGRARSHGDHRVAMALAVAGLAATGPVEVEGWRAVGTSYPEFARDLQELAG